MTNSKSLPVSLPQSKVIPAQMSAAMLRALADSLDVAMNAPITVVSRAQRIGELAGVEYGGPQTTDLGLLHYFREPVTGTSLAVWDRELTVNAVLASAKAAHVRFAPPSLIPQ